MFENQPRPVSHAADGAYPGEGPPDLRPLRAVAEAAELADAVAGLTDSFGRPLPASDPLHPLGCAVARALIEAGFTLHRCAEHDPLHRLGGVCLLPVLAGHDPEGRTGVVASWTAHDLLSPDWDRWHEYHATHEVMNEALGRVLDGLGFQVAAFGVGGAHIVTGRREASGQESRR